MARITWQDVAAPDFRDAILARSTAGNMMGEALSGLSNIASKINGKQRSAASAEAMAAAQQISDVGAWDRIMQSQGIAGFGVDPSKLTSEAMNFMQNYRTSLLNQDGKEATNLSQDLRNTDDARVLNNNFIVDERAEASYQTNLEGARIADQFSNLGLSKEATASAIIAEGFGGGVEQAALNALNNNIPAEQFAVDGMAIDQLRGQDGFRQPLNSLDQYEAELNWARQTNPLLDLYTMGMENFEGGDIVGGLLKYVKSANTDNPEELDVKHWQGTLVEGLRDLKSQYRNVPDQVIGAVMQNSLRGNLIGNPKIDWKGARNTLDQLNNEATINQLNGAAIAYGDRVEDMTNNRNQIEELMNQIARFQRVGNQAGLDRSMQQLANIQNNVSNLVASGSPFSTLLADVGSGGPTPQITVPTVPTAPITPEFGSIDQFGNPTPAALAQSFPQPLQPPKASDLQYFGSPKVFQSPGMTDQEISSLDSMNQEDVATLQGQFPRIPKYMIEELLTKMEAGALQQLTEAGVANLYNSLKNQ